MHSFLIVKHEKNPISNMIYFEYAHTARARQRAEVFQRFQLPSIKPSTGSMAGQRG